MVSPLQGDRVVLVSCPKPPGRMLLSCELTLGCSVDLGYLVKHAGHHVLTWLPV